MEKFNDLKSILPDKIYYDVKNILEIYFKQYDYLSVSIKSWEKVVLQGVKSFWKEGINPHVFAGSLSRKLDETVRNFILSNIKKEETKIFDKLIVKLCNSYRLNYRLILTTFIREFAKLEISFDSNLYSLLKNKSENFKELLNLLGISNYSYEEFLKYLQEELNFSFDKPKSDTIKTEQSTLKDKEKDKKSSDDERFSILNTKLNSRRKKMVLRSLKSLEYLYKEKGYTEEEFNMKVESIIKAMDKVVVASEDEYMRIFLDMLYEDLNNGIKRA